MSNKRSIESTLIASLLSILLCTAMFVGTSFAWFTDSVTVKVSSITASIPTEAPVAASTYPFLITDESGAPVIGETVEFACVIGEDGIVTYSLPAIIVKNIGDASANLSFTLRLSENATTAQQAIFAQISYDDSYASFFNVELSLDSGETISFTSVSGFFDNTAAIYTEEELQLAGVIISLNTLEDPNQG